MADKRPVRNREDLKKRFAWEADDITVTRPGGEIVDIAKKPPEDPTTGKDVNPKVPKPVD